MKQSKTFAAQLKQETREKVGGFIANFKNKTRLTGNSWFYLADGAIHLYIRCFQPPGSSLRFDLASVDVDENRQGQGLFTVMFEEIERLCQEHGVDVIKIENVLTDQFANFFKKRDYTVMKQCHEGVPWILEKRLDKNTII